MGPPAGVSLPSGGLSPAACAMLSVGQRFPLCPGFCICLLHIHSSQADFIYFLSPDALPFGSLADPGRDGPSRASRSEGPQRARPAVRASPSPTHSPEAKLPCPETTWARARHPETTFSAHRPPGFFKLATPKLSPCGSPSEVSGPASPSPLSAS